ncbi:phospholipid/cholesterol/gamma-HCH transport system permease protein [Allofrancisella inopinata]|uniref:ABC transporter permease n=1 Tax=Allofrancisella inopinata TaxID=1085647 RepID=A0AAE6YGT4_9GAMM|nr:MlaE family lipid ABC transporter permease subunit [Allofrancisella inopinata]QIV95483.1 ABC transporter permease [Allofrancisella inopinata]TDT72619.1 phospholipid/cholesterol/gamma-HCH transport system permease protein [Allofrancisella inopinata]
MYIFSKIYELTISFIYSSLKSLRLIINTLSSKFSIKDCIIQIKAVGINSLIIIVTSGVFIGLVLSLQGYYTLAKFGAHSLLGTLVALSVLRELGPVVTAMLFAGRACSSITSEIGLMKATDQINSLKMMNVSPISFILSTRFWACMIGVPILTLIFCSVSIIASYMLAESGLGIGYGEFWSNIQSSVNLSDISNGLVKSLVFAFVVAWIALYQGYYCVPNSNGIAMATTKTVVYCCMSVLGADLILTSIMFGGA